MPACMMARFRTLLGYNVDRLHVGVFSVVQIQLATFGSFPQALKETFLNSGPSHFNNFTLADWYLSAQRKYISDVRQK